MFQFPGFAFVPYLFRNKYFLSDDRRPTTENRCSICLIVPLLSSGSGFPHSEIHGSKPVRGSPWLIAAYHVLLRLSAPRHPPNTLTALDRSHCQCSPEHR